MKFYRAELLDNLTVSAGETFELESLRVAVIPPHLMLMPFLELPDEIKVEEQLALDEDGVHGCIYRLKTMTSCEDKIVVGFRNLQTGEVTHRKEIRITVR